jgi:glycosyltransferase involved in cell wall biosynthesis
MRIMLVTDQYPPMVGGVPTVTHSLAVDFTRHGQQVWVIAPSSDMHNAYSLEDKVHVYRFASFEWPMYEGQRLAFLPFLAMRQLIKDADPDVLHIHSPAVLGLLAQYLAWSFRKPVIATNHFMPGNMSRSLASSTTFNKGVYTYLTWFYNRCTYVTAPTTTALKLLHAYGLLAPSGVISNGIDLQTFTPGERDPEIRRRFHLPADRPLALHVSRLSAEKRIDVLLAAAARMQGNGHIALAGIGPAEAILRAQAQRLQLGDRVSFLGFVSNTDLLALRRASDVYVIPSEAELQSLSTMEAMACGLPVIAANACALPELVHHNRNGILFQPGNYDELAYHLDILLSNADLRSRMGTESLEIISKHGRSEVLKQWEELYQGLSADFRETETSPA